MTGASGSGKSTLGKLLLGFSLAEEGSVQVGKGLLVDEVVSLRPRQAMQMELAAHAARQRA